MRKRIFPQRLYVVREEDKSEVYYLTYKNLSEVPEDQSKNPVAIYDLVEKKTLKIKKELV